MNNKRIRINVFISMAARGLALLVSLAYTSVLLNYLGDTLYGIWAIVLNVISMIYYFDIGVGNGLRNKLAESETNGDKEESSKYVSTGYVAIAIVSVIFCSILILVWNVAPLAAFFNLDVEGINAQLVVTISLLFLMANFIISINKTILFAVQKPGLISIASLIGQVAQLVAVLLLWWLASADIIIMSIVYGAISMVENIILGIYVRAKYPYLVFNPKKVKKGYFRPLMSLGIMFFIMQIGTLVLNTTDNLLISRIFSPADVTPYNISYKVFYMFVQIHGIIIMPMWSAFTEAKARKDFLWMKSEIKKLNIITLIMALGALVLIFIFRPFAHIWLQQDLEYSHLIELMALYVVITMFANNYSSLLCGVGEVKIASFLALIEAAINIPLSIALAEHTSLGINGIIMGSIVSVSLSLIIFPINYRIWIEKMIKNNPPDHLPYEGIVDSNYNKSILLYGKRVDNPAYSIYIPTFNRPELLKQSIESAVNQLFDLPYEIVIVDNNPDLEEKASLEVVSSFNDPRIVYFKNEDNLGMIGNWNRATELCHSNIIIHLADDDVLSPHYLKTISKIIKDDFYGILGVGYKPFSTEISFDGCEKSKLSNITYKDFFYGININITGMLYTKDFFYGCGGFKEEMYPMADTFLISKAAQCGVLYNVDAVLAGYRVDNQNATLKDDTLINIITKYHEMRRTLFATNRQNLPFFKKHEGDFVDLYIDGAESYWKKPVDRNLVFHQLQLDFKASKLYKKLINAYIKLLKLDFKFRKKQVKF